MCIGTSSVMEMQPQFTAAGPVRSLPLTEARIALMNAARSARANLLQARTRAIDELCAKASSAGELAERGYWTLVYDFEMAPPTNSRTMLVERGVIPVPPQDLHGEQEVHEALWTVIEALSAAGVHLLNTDHLSDSQLYERLFYKILDEPTHALPPVAGASEFIDVLHPWDVDAGGQGAALSDRIISGKHPEGERVTGARAAVHATAPADRDRFLPQPEVPEGFGGKGGGGGSASILP